MRIFCCGSEPIVTLLCPHMDNRVRTSHLKRISVYGINTTAQQVHMHNVGILIMH